MSPVAERLDGFTAAFEAFRQDDAFGAGPLTDARVAAFERFQAAGFPTTRDEEWRFTPVSAIAGGTFARPGQASPDEAAIAPYRLPGGAAHEVVLVNGRLSAALSAPGAPGGVTIGPLAGSIVTAADLAVDDLASQVVDLNAAFFEEGLVIDVAAKVVVEQPIHVLHVTAAGDTSVMVAPRLVIRAGEQSQVTVIETFVSLGDTPTFTNAVTKADVANAAVVDHIKLQREPAGTFHLATIAASTGRAGLFRSHAITLGGRIVRNDIISRLRGEGADCTLNGLYVADGETLVDTHTTIDHAEPHCPSHEVYKGILSGKARAVFNGKIIVRQKAQKTDAKQTNKALLLSDDAQINSKPQLEIFADDVRCTHGATVGQLDEDQLFYLRARGVPKLEARNMLIHAFAGDVLDGVRVEAVRDLALRLVDQKLSL